MTAAQALKAPFPYFGGKSRAADLIWSRFGDVSNYVEPFAGSLAVLLARPHTPGTETVNDLDGLLSNAWRAIRADPDAVAYHADQPVVEVDLTARHLYLVNAREHLTERLMADPEYYDAKLAGWWVWGACNWIGSGWCSGEGPWQAVDGVLTKRARGQLAGDTRKLPHLGDAGKGVSRQLPYLSYAGGCGVSQAKFQEGARRKLPNLSSHGSGMNSERAVNPGVLTWMRELSERLRRVRICCGDWSRVAGESVTTKHGLTGVLLDPPYIAEGADNDVYGVAHTDVAHEVRAWALANGNNPELRIALCGYEEHAELLDHGWTAQPWKARKGYQGVQEDGSHNGHREVIMFSPHCLQPELEQRVSLFGGTL